MADVAPAPNEQQLLHELGTLVAMESPSGDVAHLDVLRDDLAARLRDTGADVRMRRGPAGDHLDATLGGGPGPHVVLLGHYDTVWPVGRLADAPFALADGIVTGPGVFDMKGGLVALLWALRNLAAEPAHPLRIVLTADEEVGSPSGREVVLDAGAGAVAVFALEPPLPHGRLKVGRRGVARSRLVVTGREAHAGLDAAAGVSAIDELADQLLALRSAVPATPELSVNVGTVAGGSRANVIAGRAQAELGLRFATAAAEQQLHQALAGLTPRRDGARLEIESLSHRPAWEPHHSQRLGEHVLAVARALGEDLDAGVSPGGGDANLTGAAGVPTVDGLGPRGHGAHAPDEALELASLPARARLLRQLLLTPIPATAR